MRAAGGRRALRGRHLGGCPRPHPPEEAQVRRQSRRGPPVGECGGLGAPAKPARSPGCPGRLRDFLPGGVGLAQGDLGGGCRAQLLTASFGLLQWGHVRGDPFTRFVKAPPVSVRLHPVHQLGCAWPWLEQARRPWHFCFFLGSSKMKLNILVAVNCR